MISGGVPAGATTPSQNGALQLRIAEPPPWSARPAAFGLRSLVTTASGRSLAATGCAAGSVVLGSVNIWTSPASSAASIGAVPR